MINVDDRLIKEDLPGKLGVDAFTILFAITSHLGKNNTKLAWPGINRIRELCKVEINGQLKKMPRLRAYNAIKRLEEHGFVKRWQENIGGVFGKVKYKLTTKYLSVFMGVDAFEMEAEEQENRNAKFRITENRNAKFRITENEHTEDIKEREAINEVKCINEGEMRGARAQEPSGIDDLILSTDSLRSKISMSGINGVSVENRNKLKQLYQPYLKTESFKEQWKHMQEFLPTVDKEKVLHEWFLNGNYNDIKEVRINVLRYWIQKEVEKNERRTKATTGKLPIQPRTGKNVITC